MRRAAIAVLLGLGLAGCPIPQPLPDYPAGTITPPRILMDPLVGDGFPIVFVPANCVTTAPSYPLSLQIADTNTIESVEARVFVNYDARYTTNFTPIRDYIVPPNSDTTDLIRNVPAASASPAYFEFLPYDYPPAPGTPDVNHGTAPFPEPNLLRVVEFVVSNGFASSSVAPPYRAPAPTYETQVYRWVFLSVPESAAVPCP